MIRPLIPRGILIYWLVISGPAQISEMRCGQLLRGYARRSATPPPVSFSPPSFKDDSERQNMRKLYITYSDRHLRIHSSQPDRIIFLPGAQRTLASASIKMKVSGKDEERKKKEREVGTWTRLVMSAGETLHMGMIGGGEGGYRVYLAMRGGFPEIQKHEFGVGGYQVRRAMFRSSIYLIACILIDSLSRVTTSR